MIIYYHCICTHPTPPTRPGTCDWTLPEPPPSRPPPVPFFSTPHQATHPLWSGSGERHEEPHYLPNTGGPVSGCATMALARMPVPCLLPSTHFGCI